MEHPLYKNSSVEGYTNMDTIQNNGNEMIEVVDVSDGPDYNQAYSSMSSEQYMNSLPKGIPASDILGDEDPYILKSEVVTPVCPVCPPQIMKCKDGEEPGAKKCPPCPPCARCPEPAFDCKKVPNYGTGNLGANYNNFDGAFGRLMTPDGSSPSLPQPALNDYTTFGT